MPKSVLSIAAGFNAGAFASDKIKDQFFGANFLLGRDSLTGTYADKIENFGVSLIRYPGGTITENIFDINNPDNVPVSADGTYETLSKFLDYSGSIGAAPVIVIPTLRYAGNVQLGVQEITNFVQRLTAGEFSSTPVFMIEIGNEYYATGGTNAALTAAQYGDIASQFAEAINAAAAYDIEISVQAGRNTADNQTITSFFDTSAEISAVDVIVYHDYPWQFDSIAGRASQKAALAGAWRDNGIDPKIFLSEWNIGSSPDSTKDPLHDYGLQQASALVEMVSEAIKVGVDYGAVWAVQQNNKTSLTGNEGSADIRFAGYVFDMLQESLPGKRVLDDALFSISSSKVVLHAFEDDTEISLFVSARDFDDVNVILSVDIDLTAFGNSIAFADVKKLSTSGDPDDYNALAIYEEFQLPVLSTVSGSSFLQFELEKSYELVEIVFQKLAMDAQGGMGDDTLTGGMLSDRIYGAAGDDQLQGNGGADFLYGDAGNDTLSGDSGDDTLVDPFGTDTLSGGEDNDLVAAFSGDNDIGGDAGADLLVGGTGRDTLTGGSGNDVMLGDISSLFFGNDYLEGGSGDDYLQGGGGADEFFFRANDGSDTIAVLDIDYLNPANSTAIGSDFVPGLDTISLSGFGYASGAQALLQVQDLGGNAVFSDQGTTIIFYGLQASDLNETDFFVF